AVPLSDRDGRIPHMAQAANCSVYVGVARWTGGTLGGLFRQVAGEDRGERLNGGLPDDAVVEAITVHPDETSVIYAGTADGPYRSIDGGKRWERVGFPDAGVQIWSIQPCPGRPRTLFAGASPVAVY